MDILSVIIIGFGLSTDSFFMVMLLPTASDFPANLKTIMPAVFAGIQCVILVAGWLLGISFLQFVSSYVHWISCVLLASIAGKILYNLVSNKHKNLPLRHQQMSLMQVVLFAVATGVDSLPAGISIGLLKYDLVKATAIIAFITFIMIAIALYAGRKFAEEHVRGVAYAVAVLLIVVSVRIAVYHLPA